VDLIVNIQGLAPVYRTVQSAFPAYIGLYEIKIFFSQTRNPTFILDKQVHNE
jgi:hypothetical protein